MVRSIESVLGAHIERRTLKGFDYTKTAPSRDAEFARPKQQPQRRIKYQVAGGHASKGPEKKHFGPAEKTTGHSSAVPGSGEKNGKRIASLHASGSANRSPWTHKSVNGR
jgi:ATP-dependent RNA helicase RhlE